MGNTARDYSEELNAARSGGAQMPNAEKSHPGDLHMHGAADNYSGVPSSGSADNYSQTQGDDSRTDRLSAARQGSVNETAQVAKDLAQTASPVGSMSVLKQIDFMADMPFIAALGAALLKDLLDFVAAPTVILSILFSILCSIFIFMMLLLVSANDKRGMAKSLIKRGLILVGGGIADSIPGIDFFPIESLTVAVIYYLTLVERKNAGKE